VKTGRKNLLLLFAGIVLLTDAFAFQDKGYVIRGRITDSSGIPLSGAVITIENTFLGAHCNPDGTYVFNGLKDGVYTLHFSYIGYESQLHEIKLVGEVRLDVSLIQKSIETGEVTVNATRAGNHTPLAYSTISSEFLRKQNTGQDIPFLLSLTPSLVETSEAGNGIGYTNLRIRGTDASRINVTIDGIPLNDAESQQVFWVDLPDLSSSIDNIQVQRGVGTSSNGAGAFGATISIQTKSPENEPFAQVASSLGSFNTVKNTIAAGTGLLANRFAFQVRLSNLKSNGYIERTGSNHHSAYISGIFRTGRSHLKANIIFGEEHTGIGWWGVPKGMLDINRRYNPAGEFTDENGITRYYENESDNYKQNHYQLIYSFKVNNDLNFSTAVHYTRGKGYYEEYREESDFFDYGIGDITIGNKVISATDLIRRKWMANDFYGLIYSLKYRKGKIEATIGGGANNYSGDHYGRIIWMRYAGNLEQDYQWYQNTGRKSELNLFGKADYSVNDNISLFADLQYRYLIYKMTGIDDDLKDLYMKQYFGFFNPKAGMFFNITPEQDAYFSLSVANREPTRADFEEATGDANATPKPETLYDAELGYKLRQEKFSAAVNLYGMFYKDQLVPTGELSNVGYSIMTNVENSSRLGAEINTGIKPFSILDWNLSITLSRSKIRDYVEYYNDYISAESSEVYKSKKMGTVDIAYSPSVVAVSDINIKMHKNIELHFISKFVGKQYFDNTMNLERMIDPYFVNNLRLDLEPAIHNIKRAEFQVLISNIFNNKYESNAYGGNWYEDGAEKSWSYFFPQAGINFMLRAGFTF
jgi:iron complex outermembrane recepter protein